MNYVYHGVPEPIVGTNLVPLNQMEQSMYGVRYVHLKKYQGREEILERKIPLLDCLWNDVVQFLPLHPRKVFELQVKLGIIPEVPLYKFFEIPVDILDMKKMAVFFKSAPGDENTEVKWFQDVDFNCLQNIPQATIDYYQTMVGTNELPFNYQFVPNVLYKGTVDISGVEIITI